MRIPPRWRAALLALAILAAVALAYLALSQPAPATAHAGDGAMTASQMCAHMPEHCPDG